MSKERLTERFCNGKAAVKGCGANCNYGYEYCVNHVEDCPTIIEVYDKLAEYEDLEEQGLLLRLPCKRVCFICDKGSKYATVMSKSIYDLEVYQIKEIDVKGHYFSTEEKAEEKLRELEGK